MTQNIKDLLVVDIDDSILITANIISEERIKHEYDRFNLPWEERRLKIRAGIISELIFSNLLHGHKIPYLYYFVIGQYDKGFDFRIGNSKIDMKSTLFESRGKNVDACLSVIFNKFNLFTLFFL